MYQLLLNQIRCEMKKYVVLILILSNIYSCTLNAQKESKMNLIEKNGMQAQWNWEGESLYFQVFAPKDGWVAIGLNVKTGLAGTNLIMGAVTDGKVKIDDRYTLKPGNHQAIKNLGGKDLLTKKNGFEDEKGTTITFKIPTLPNDKYHINIEKGKEYYMLLAYSMADDFGHHSMMRTEVKIIF